MNENAIFEEHSKEPDIPGKKPIHVPSLVIGILSIVFALLFALIGDILGIAGIVMSAVKRKNYKTTAALVCSVIGLVLAIANHVLSIIMIMPSVV